jgi:zinc transporter ZupT
VVGRSGVMSIYHATKTLEMLPCVHGPHLMTAIGIQNLPEGTAVAVPLRGAGMSRFKSFFMGQLSAIVGPIATVMMLLDVALG